MSVTVDDDFARFGSKSYAINKINSVEVRERAPHSRGWAIFLGILAVLAAISALGQIALPDGAAAGTFVVALVLVGLSYWQWQRSKVRVYSLFLMTSSSEAQAFVTRDANEVVALRDRIEAAMSQRR